MTWYTVRTINCPSIILPDIPLCRESKCSNLYLSRRFSSMFVRHSVFDQLWDFFPKNRYGKTVATFRTMWIPIQTRSSIRQVVHSKSRRSDASLHGPEARATYMEIVCIRSIVRTTYSMVQTYEALLWKLRAAKVWSSGRQDNTARTRINLRKNFCKIWKVDRTVVRSDATVRMTPRFFKPNAHLNLQPINRGP